MIMWRFKSCPRCGGDIFVERDQYGWYKQCLQCSFRRDLKSPAEHKEQLVLAGATEPRRRPVS